MMEITSHCVRESSSRFHETSSSSASGPGRVRLPPNPFSSSLNIWVRRAPHPPQVACETWRRGERRQPANIFRLLLSDFGRRIEPDEKVLWPSVIYFPDGGPRVLFISVHSRRRLEA